VLFREHAQISSLLLGKQALLLAQTPLLFCETALLLGQPLLLLCNSLESQALLLLGHTPSLYFSGCDSSGGRRGRGIC
jgi:hypothetical protein